MDVYIVKVTTTSVARQKEGNNKKVAGEMKNGYFLSLLGKHKCFYYTTCYSSSGSTSIRQLRTLLFSSLVYPSRSE